MQICMDLRHSKRVFGLSALTGYLVVVGLLLLFRAPLEVILWGLGPPRDFDIQTHSRLAAPSPATAVRSQGDPASGRDHSSGDCGPLGLARLRQEREPFGISSECRWAYSLGGRLGFHRLRRVLVHVPPLAGVP